MNQIKPIENTPNLCWKCLKEYNKIHIFKFGNLGYGSSFDEFGSQIQLCDDCYKKSHPEIWDFKLIDEENIFGEHYKYEDEIFEYINNLPLVSRELFYNETCFGRNADHLMIAQDWIDYKLNILSHEKCKEYGLYSPQERQAYKDRFPTCGKVYKKIYFNGGSACQCHRGSHGQSDGSCDKYNISDKCYRCFDYVPKKDAIKIVYETEEFIKNETEQLGEMLERYITIKTIKRR